MHPGTRIALALLIAKILPYLIAPSRHTWLQLPSLLRPTILQMQVPHDITTSFLPVPALRDSLIRRPMNWLESLLFHRLFLKWAGEWGNTGQAQLTNAGNWSHRPQPLSEFAETSFSIETGSAKAILCDPITERRFISDEFQKSCWNTDNWCASKSILGVWPELDGQIELF